MKRRIAAIALTSVILIPFLINLAGWNIYFYTNFGSKDLVLASAIGVSHTAWAEHVDMDDSYGMDSHDMPLLEDYTTTILDLGPFNLFLERREGPMAPFTFRWIAPDEYLDYRGLEFPWLLLLLAPIAILVAPKLKSTQSKTEESNPDSSP